MHDVDPRKRHWEPDASVILRDTDQLVGNIEVDRLRHYNRV